MEEITIYKFQLEQIVDALRMTGNAYNLRSKDSCLSRTFVLAEKYANNSLKGEKDKKESYL